MHKYALGDVIINGSSSWVLVFGLVHVVTRLSADTEEQKMEHGTLRKGKMEAGKAEK